MRISKLNIHFQSIQSTSVAEGGQGCMSLNSLSRFIAITQITTNIPVLSTSISFRIESLKNLKH